MLKGTIALDIDGTITDGSHMIPDEVVSYFEALYAEGWRFILVTGRMFSFAMTALGKINFPYYLAVQNGADLLIMPKKEHLKNHYFTFDVIQQLDELYVGEKEDFIIYAGYEKGDICYYRPSHFSPYMLGYLDRLKKLSELPWQEVECFKEAKQRVFPLIKCFGTKAACEAFQQKLKKLEGIETSVIKDPISEELYLVLVNHKEANKGSAVTYFMQRYNLPRPLITGGDDNNDIPLLRVGDIRIAMENAPDALQNIAQIIAPPSTRHGIMHALNEAIEGLS